MNPKQVLVLTAMSPYGTVVTCTGSGTIEQHRQALYRLRRKDATFADLQLRLSPFTESRNSPHIVITHGSTDGQI